MSESRREVVEQVNVATATVERRVILSMGGKGGVGKTSVMAGLAEWFAANDIPVKLLDLDSENKARGSLTHFFGGSVPKIMKADHRQPSRSEEGAEPSLHGRGIERAPLAAVKDVDSVAWQFVESSGGEAGESHDAPTRRGLGLDPS